ncbi:MAG: 16S rRNA (cytosine(1402)-N(4))-methyltransferase RsmH, partial [Alphaproteobacteria bacterium]
ARGFSFAHDGPLDMRMDRTGQTAADVVNGTPEGDLADIIYNLGEERLARRIARAIVAARAEKPIQGTGELASIVRGVMPPRNRRRGRGIDPATRTFQALRIHVNDELGELDRGLVAAEQLLRPGGRLAVVSFHSLEDRRVKVFLRARSGGARGGSRHLPAEPEPPCAPSFLVRRNKAIKPSEAEATDNPRARSARLRVGERTQAAVWPLEAA